MCDGNSYAFGKSRTQKEEKNPTKCSKKALFVSNKDLGKLESKTTMKDVIDVCNGKYAKQGWSKKKSHLQVGKVRYKGMAYLRQVAQRSGGGGREPNEVVLADRQHLR